MIYRTLGSTGLQVSEIGLGCEGFTEQEGMGTYALVDAAADAGINYFDLYSPDPNLRLHLGKALAGRRDQFIIQAHLCSVWKDGQYKRTRKLEEVQAGFEDLLHQLHTDHVEIGMIHYVDSLKDWQAVAEGPVMRYAQQLKQEGRIGYIGLSSHNPQVAIQAVESGLIEVLMFSVNPCYDLQPGDEDLEKLWADESYARSLVNMDPQREALYELCQRQGVGITVMKPFGGGDLLDEKLSPAGKALTPVQCLHYALTRPGVATVLPGAHTVEELRQSVAYETASVAERDYASALASFPKISWKGHCMYCGHCAPCPMGIDIATVTKFLNLVKAQGEMPETVREHYAVLEHTASECIRCHACENRCPFDVEVTENMRQAVNVFGK